MSKHVLYVCTKQADYSRIKMIRSALEAHASVDMLFSTRKTYFGRVAEVALRFIFHRKQAYDCVVVGFFAQLIFPWIRLFWRGKIIADCYISLYDSFVHDRGMAGDSGLTARLLRWLDGFLLRHCSIALTDTEDHVTYLSEEFGVSPAKIRAIPISADAELFPCLQNAVTDLSDEETMNVLFFGAYIPLQGVDVIVRAAHLLREYNIRFSLLGAGQTYDEVCALAAELKATNVDFLGWQPVESIADHADQSHLVLGIFGRTDKAKRVIPNKVFEALSMGRPVITGDSQVMRDEFEHRKDIMLVPFDDPKALADEILWVRSHYVEALAIASNGHKVFREDLSPEKVTSLIGEVLEEL